MVPHHVDRVWTIIGRAGPTHPDPMDRVWTPSSPYSPRENIMHLVAYRIIELHTGTEKDFVDPTIPTVPALST